MSLSREETGRRKLTLERLLALEAEDMSSLYLSARYLPVSAYLSSHCTKETHFLIVGLETPARAAELSDLMHSWADQLDVRDGRSSTRRRSIQAERCKGGIKDVKDAVVRQRDQIRRQRHDEQSGHDNPIQTACIDMQVCMQYPMSCLSARDKLERGMAKRKGKGGLRGNVNKHLNPRVLSRVFSPRPLLSASSNAS